MVAQDSLYRRYVLVCLLYNFAAMTYVSYIPAFLEKTCITPTSSALLLHIIPAVVSFLTTGWLGRWFDRTRLSAAWAWGCLRLGVGPVLLAATAAAGLFGPAALIIPVLARISRGTVQGGSVDSLVADWRGKVRPHGWGKPARYQGILVFVDGITRMTAPAVGWVLAASGSSREALFVVGGLGVMLSGVLFLFDATPASAAADPPDAPDTQFRDGAP